MFGEACSRGSLDFIMKDFLCLCTWVNLSVWRWGFDLRVARSRSHLTVPTRPCRSPCGFEGEGPLHLLLPHHLGSCWFHFCVRSPKAATAELCAYRLGPSEGSHACFLFLPQVISSGSLPTGPVLGESQVSGLEPSSCNKARMLWSGNRSELIDICSIWKWIKNQHVNMLWSCESLSNRTKVPEQVLLIVDIRWQCLASSLTDVNVLIWAQRLSLNPCLGKFPGISGGSQKGQSSEFCDMGTVSSPTALANRFPVS